MSWMLGNKKGETSDARDLLRRFGILLKYGRSGVRTFTRLGQRRALQA